MKPLHENETESPWTSTEKMPVFSKLSEDIRVDVCVVGGGIAGLSTAYHLAYEGKSVCVLEDFELGSGQSGRTTAHFVTALDNRFFQIEKYHGLEKSRLAAESHRAAIERVAEIVSKEGIQCELERLDGYLFASGDLSANILERELKAAVSAGLSDVQMLEKSPFDFFDTGPCLKFPNQLQLHPLKYLRGLSNCIVNAGGQIFTNTHVNHIQGGADAGVTTSDGFAVKCNAVVVATNTPINDLVAIHTKQAAYRTYVIGIRIPKGSVPKGLYWDTLDPYHYIRVESLRAPSYGGLSTVESELLIIGGEDHKTGQNSQGDDPFGKIESWTRTRFQMATDVLYRWSGQVMEPVDGIAYLGHNPLDKNNVYVITGDSGNGMTHATIGAMLITDQIMGRKNEWESLYNPSRICLPAISEFIRENSNVVVQYGDWFSLENGIDEKNIPIGEGAILRKGLKRIAAYKDLSGKVELLSAVCTHLKGIVSWNSVEKTWDCPCHGSRFDCHGRVIEGPANTNLKKLSFTKSKSSQRRKKPLETPEFTGSERPKAMDVGQSDVIF